VLDAECSVFDYRRSYRKTVVAGTVLALGGVMLLGFLLRLAWLGAGNWAWTAWLLWASGAGAGALALAWIGLVVAGGIIALRRDALEARGIPYASSERRESLPGPFVSGWRRLSRTVRSPFFGVAGRLDLRPGELVETKSLEEILGTLDERGTLDAMPFMPEMAAYCGRQARVFRRIDKLNDWVWGTGLHRMHATVLLEDLRCTGAAHGGCQANCHLRWKEAWLRRVPGTGMAAPTLPVSPPQTGQADLERLSRRTDDSGSTRYICQATELTSGSTPLAWNDPRHYARDLLLGNVRLGPFMVGVSLACFNALQRKRGGMKFPLYIPSAPKTTPLVQLELRAGELVRVRSKREIEPTLNAGFRNRGLWFDADMLRFCGGEYRVETRIERLIVEKTGELKEIGNPCITLEGVKATGEYLAFNPENESIFWREAWLERVPASLEAVGVPGGLAGLGDPAPPDRSREAASQ
jgi:hypothetical protein